MVAKEFTIINKLGIHARPAALIAKTANHYRASIKVQKDGLEVNGKSIMGIMMLAAAKGNKITISAEGTDEAEAVEALGRLIHEKFGED
jgi:phosphocarrier protein HPr